MHTWVKLHLALDRHAVSRDPYACHVFIHLLMRADSKGNGIVNRASTSGELGLKPMAFYRALQRCQKTYSLVTLVGTSKYTRFSIFNWEKYQSVGNSKMYSAGTAQEQRPYIDKEYRQEKKGKSFSEKKTTNTLPVEPCIDGLEQLRESMRMKGLRA